MNTIKHNSKLKEYFSILMSGITGALALTGICIILFLIGFAVRNPFISRLYSETFAKCSFEGLFITTSGLGFILGLIIRRRLLTLKNQIALIAVFSVPLIIGAWFLYTFASYSEFVRGVKIADCTNIITNVSFKAPKGHNYCFTLALPSGSTNAFSGQINISDGKINVTNFNIGFGQTEQPIIFLHPETNYDIKISFDQPPPPLTSIWLYWREGYRDRHS